jgi:thiamine-phosphate pyrophosphorylase
MPLVLPKLYVILDAALLTNSEIELARRLAEAGVRLIQYRNKKAAARELFERSREISELLRPYGVRFIVNDRPDVAYLANADGVHVGQEDLDVGQARGIIGREKWVGISTHNLKQFQSAIATSADYIAVGPIFSTSTKANPDPVVGSALLRQVRPLTDKAIVAIGGITLERAAGVIEAGADSLAVSSDILHAADPVRRARQFLDLLEPANHAAAV